MSGSAPTIVRVTPATRRGVQSHRHGTIFSSPRVTGEMAVQTDIGRKERLNDF